jgi:hypothetical protein
MGKVIMSIPAKVIRGSMFGGLIIATFGLSSIAEATLFPGSVKAADHQFYSETALLRLVDTRDHDEGASADRPMTEKSTPKKKTDQSMKHAPGVKDQSSRKHRTNEQHDDKGSKSAESDEQLSLEEANDKLDRPDDRRQGKNLERKP